MMLPRVRPSDPMNARQCADSKKTRLKIKRATGYRNCFLFSCFFRLPELFPSLEESPKEWNDAP